MVRRHGYFDSVNRCTVKHRPGSLAQAQCPDHWVVALATLELCAPRADDPELALKVLSGYGMEMVRQAVAELSITAPALLDLLAEDEDELVRLNVASNESTPAGALERLAADAEPEVRRAVTRNPAASPQALAILAGDDDFVIRYMLAGRSVL